MHNRKMFSFITFFLVFLLGTSLSAQIHEYKDYTVKKGDTLWDISNKELGDTFLWPKIWKENPKITNPDRIYPGQKIKIPLYLLQKEIPLSQIPEAKAEKKEETKKEILKKVEQTIKEYLVSKDILIASGYIADTIHSVGSIVDSSSGRIILGKGDYAYVKTVTPVKIGDKFYIIRSAGKVIHPKSGSLLGYLIEVPGIAEVIEQKNNEIKVQITDSFMEIFIGDLIDSYYEIDPPFITNKTPRKPNMNAYIVATKELRLLNGKQDIAYIDKGEKENLKIGDIFSIIEEKHREEKGLLQIINIKKATSTGIIKKSSDTISIGDEVTGTK
ncbi:MAG: LysM peptidoglycan-binding domain-containing protein [Nitrospirae bacterium]|nr:LysM peptidoglycan-binding domain-containing protein [Nitrospirota bacterium]